METCKNCGGEIVPDGWGYGYCDGIITMDHDPYMWEIEDDDTLYVMCSGRRYESSQEI